MDPVTLSTHNFTYRGDGESVGDLTGIRNDDGSFTSHFELSAEELDQVASGLIDAETGSLLVELTILGSPIPPVMVKAVPR
jgi:hypothetical protein